ncbi:hypothetical protein ElyMa_002380300 [Elysia marginata]|uniref:Uncharacterized protein n=1 Tax=Elysia marginata TaxID=1093978 RepID=A0AAV4GCQ2_9GAST|nr:hypothetical protein ElyMa_002380300 [Elysia marginata]
MQEFLFSLPGEKTKLLGFCDCFGDASGLNITGAKYRQDWVVTCCECQGPRADLLGNGHKSEFTFNNLSAWFLSPGFSPDTQHGQLFFPARPSLSAQIVESLRGHKVMYSVDLSLSQIH